MKILTSTLCLLLFCAIAVAQAPNLKQWDYRYGSGPDDKLGTIIQTTDYGFLLGGAGSYNLFTPGDMTTPTVGQRQYDFWVVKLNSAGIKQWDKIYGHSRNDILVDMKLTSDGGYILAGYSKSDSGADKSQPNWDATLATPDYWIVKIDGQGNKQWDKRFGGTGQEMLYAVEQTKDGGYIMGGTSYSGTGGDRTQAAWDSSYSDFWIVKTDAQGNKQWDKRFGAVGGGSEFRSMDVTRDGGYILGGYLTPDVNAGGDVTQPVKDNTDYWIVKIDSIGNKLWDRRYGSGGSSGANNLYDVAQALDNGFIMLGVSTTHMGGDKTEELMGPGCVDFWLIKVDSLGNKLWDRVIGGPGAEAYEPSLQVLRDGYLIAGVSSSDQGGSKSEDHTHQGATQTWVIKVNLNGNKIWDKTIFTDAFESTGKALQLYDGCYVITNDTYGGIGGYKTQGNWNTTGSGTQGDLWVIKFCDSTVLVLGNGEELTLKHDAVAVFPNPSIDGAWQLVVSDDLIGKDMQVCDVQGRVIWRGVIHTTNSQLTFDSPTGVYLLKVDSEKGAVTKRLVRW